MVNADELFENNHNYQKICRFGNKQLKKEFEEYIEIIKKRKEELFCINNYTKALEEMRKNSVRSFKMSICYLEKIQNYKNVPNLIEECRKRISEIEKQECENAEIARENKEYDKAVGLMRGENSDDYAQAERIFRSISGWKDADDKKVECNKIIRELIQKEKESNIEKERNIEEKKTLLKKRKQIAYISGGILCIIIILIVVLNTTIIPNWQYSKGINLMNEGRYDEAIECFTKLFHTKDSFEKLKECKYSKAKSLVENQKYKDAYMIFKELGNYEDSKLQAELTNIKSLKELQVGDCFDFGNFEATSKNIEWLVLTETENKKLVICKDAITDRKYDESSIGFVTWSNSTIRKWLNTDFYDNVFSENEKEAIFETVISVGENPNCTWEYDLVETTQDKIFLLSVNEAEKYFTSAENRICKLSGNNTKWILRTPGKNQYGVSCIDEYGNIDLDGNNTTVNNAIRPAMWIDLSKIE